MDAGPPTDAGPPPDAGAPADTRPRLGSVAPITWIYAARQRKTRIGYVRQGTSVPLREATPWEPDKKGSSGECKSGRWWSVEPRGYICEDVTVTRDLDSKLFKALAFAGAREGAFPFDFAFSTGAPMYTLVPDAKEQKKSEQRFRAVADLVKIPRQTYGHEDLDSFDRIEGKEPLPDFLADHAPAPLMPGKKPGLVKKRIPNGSMLSYSHAFAVDGRTFLLSPDLTVIPADRMRPFRRTTFHGTKVGEGAAALPLGWFRKAPRDKWKREGSAMKATGDKWAPRTWVGLTGKGEEVDGVRYVETREGGLWAREKDVSVVKEPDALPGSVEAGEKWIEVSLGRGTLTLLEGKKIIYSTLMSPGAGGVTPKPSLTVEELVGAALTPLGSYRVSVKHVAAQMTSEDKPDPESFWIADVPWVQYFRPPFAIHTAYWHEDFGQPKSGGCVNLSPEDAKVVFDWSEPHAPEGWWGVISNRDAHGTMIVIHK